MLDASGREPDVRVGFSHLTHGRSSFPSQRAISLPPRPARTGAVDGRVFRTGQIGHVGSRWTAAVQTRNSAKLSPFGP